MTSQFQTHPVPDGSACNATHFSCTEGIIKCIPQLWVCDGQIECADGSDESEDICSECKRDRKFSKS